MTNWRLAAWSRFLSNRILLYEVIELCATFPGAGTPTQYLGLNRVFSDWVCAEVDKGLAQWRIWYQGRMQQMQKSGRHSWRPKYKTLNELLGITEEVRRGGFTGKDLTDVSALYKRAVVEAAKQGEPPPDAEEWFAKYESGEPIDGEELFDPYHFRDDDDS
jgi:hypothetical protein